MGGIWRRKDSTTPLHIGVSEVRDASSRGRESSSVPSSEYTPVRASEEGASSNKQDGNVVQKRNGERRGGANWVTMSLIIGFFIIGMSESAPKFSLLYEKVP